MTAATIEPNGFLLSLQPMLPLAEGLTCVKRWYGKSCVGILRMRIDEEASVETLRDFLEGYRATGEVQE